MSGLTEKERIIRKARTTLSTNKYLKLGKVGDRIGYHMFQWNEHGVTKIKVTVDHTKHDQSYVFPIMVHYYFIDIRCLSEWELRYSVTRHSYGKDGVINNSDLTTGKVLIDDAQIRAYRLDEDGEFDCTHMPPSLFLLESRIRDLIHELHRHDDALYERYVVCDSEDLEGESDTIPF